jgi:hypothetical protein
MRKHTHEPWKVCHWAEGRKGFEIADRNQNRICFDVTEDDARRIVACVNACAGMETELLENVAMLGETLLARFELLKKQEAKLKSQRDELLAALEDLVGDVEGLIEESYGVYGLLLFGEHAPWSELESGGRFERLTSLPIACDAIAKVKGGAA